MKLRILFCLLIGLLAKGNSWSQCSLDSLIVTIGECTSGTLDVWIDFQAENTLSDRFSVKGNGHHYGDYSYNDLPVNIGPLMFDPHKNYEFVVRDLRDSSCTSFLEYGKISCFDSTCNMRDLKAFVYDSCRSDNSYKVKIDFKPGGINRFDVDVNGEFLLSAVVSQLPIIIEIPSKGNNVDTIGIRANDQTNCFSSIAVQSPLCDTSCGISNLYAKAIECGNGSFYVKLGLDHFGPHGDKFSVSGNDGQEYGSFRYSEIPLILGPIMSGSSEKLHFFVADQDYPDCVLEATLDGSPCGDVCQLIQPEIEMLRCDSGFFDLSIDFIHSGDLSDSFKIKMNGNFYGVFAYLDLPLSLSGLPADGKTYYEFVVIDRERSDCSTTSRMGPVDCNCERGNIKVLEVGECTSDSTYRVSLKSDLEGAFDIYVNGNLYATYDNSEWPLTMDEFPASGKSYDYIRFCSLDSNYCCTEIKVEAPNCAKTVCGIENIRFEISECDPNHGFNIILDFDTVGFPSETFIVQRNHDLLEFSYSELPVKLGPFHGGDEFYRFKLYDAISTNCIAEVEIGKIVCEQQCNISFGTIKFVECSGKEENDLVLLIDSLQGSFNAFDIYFGQDYLGFYKKDKLPLRLQVPYPYDTDSIKIRLCVNDQIDCCYDVVLAVPDCPPVECELSQLKLDTVECRSDSFWINLNFETAVSDFSKFLLSIDGKEILRFSRDDLPLHIGPFPARSDQNYSIKIKSLIQNDCVTEIDFKGIQCPGSEISDGNKLLILQSANYTNYVKMPAFIGDRSIFELIDLNGRVLHQMVFTSVTNRAFIQIPVSVAGMYILKLQSPDGQSYLTKIMIPS